MSETSKHIFKWRTFTSLYITISFLVMIFSGSVLYIAPPGRIAKWSYISILGFEKHQWQALHIIFTFLFVIATAFHLYFNWSAFISYLKDKLNKKYQLRRELLIALVITSGIFILILWEAPPFRNVIDFGESMKSSWSSESVEPPVPHAEEMTVGQLATTIKVESKQLIQRLKDQGIEAGPNSILKYLAEAHDLSPNDLFRKIELQKKSGSSKSHQGMRYGRKTIVQIAQKENITVSIALKRLSAAGIEANQNDNLRSLSGNSDILPIDIVNIILDKKN